MQIGELLDRRRKRRATEDLRKLARLVGAASARGRANGLLRALELATMAATLTEAKAALEAEAREAERNAATAEQRSNIR